MNKWRFVKLHCALIVILTTLVIVFGGVSLSLAVYMTAFVVAIIAVAKATDSNRS